MQKCDDILRAIDQKMYIKGVFCRVVKVHEILLDKLNFLWLLSTCCKLVQLLC